MTARTSRNQTGFTIIELVVVIVIIGILAATALPRFVDLTGDAQTASVEAMGGAFSSGVNLAHAAWIAQGANASIDSVTMEGGTTIGMNDSGWPENTAAAGGNGTVTDAECVAMWNAILVNPPTVATDTSGDYQAAAASPICNFTYTASSSGTRRVSYDSSTGRVTITSP